LEGGIGAAFSQLNRDVFVKLIKVIPCSGLEKEDSSSRSLVLVGHSSHTWHRPRSHQNINSRLLQAHIYNSQILSDLKYHNRHSHRLVDSVLRGVFKPLQVEFAENLIFQGIFLDHNATFRILERASTQNELQLW